MTDTTPRVANSGTDLSPDQRQRYELADRFRLEDGRVFLSGVQALARLPGDQLRIDRRNGLNTAAFVSGYQGSPLASFDGELMRAAGTMPDLPITIVPGVNEELAATAVMGSQLTETLDDHLYDGVIGLWYGKAPGLDRAGDAIRHGVYAGSSRHGGVVAVVGDDPSAKSSTLPSSSDATLVDLHMPVLFPGDVQEALDLGRHAVALSRASGIWAGVKLVTPVCDGTGTVDVDPDRVRPLIPTVEGIDGKPFVPRPSGRLLTPYTLEMEREFQEVRSVVAREYGVLNKLNHITVAGADDWIGLMASGHTYHELREALELLGFATDDELRRVGIRIYQLRMPVPLDDHQIRDFARGLSEIVVIEEKNPTLEWLVKNALYDGAERPKVVGKHDEHGAWLVPGTGMLDADRLLEPIHRRLSQRLGDGRLRPLPTRTAPSKIPLTVNRTPFYCSGCPHNLSTRADDTTLVGGGIGCHAMVALMEPERIGHLVGLTAMGNEGAQWIGMSPFVERDHLVQNLGDGTFAHSGHLAIRAAIAAGIDITYKLLYNGTVAMTGGQDAAGAMTVPEITDSLLLEGVSKIIITSDEPDKYHVDDFDARHRDRFEIWDRVRITEAETALAATPGTTVLLHDQMCAAEKRRARTRGKIPTPGFRVVINERVCEGCGDCGDVSNCLSVQPKDTPYGRKTTIDQTSCNFDLSCMRGDCPAFATVAVDGEQRSTTSAELTDPTDVRVDHLPDPHPVVPADGFTVRMSGIGGTGVITVSQVLGTAAMLDGYTVRGLDQTGLSQKAGPVVSDLRIARDRIAASNHAGTAGVDCLLGFDLLVAASDTHRVGADAARTVVIGSLAAVPTGSMVARPETPYPTGAALTGRLDEVSRSEHNRYVDAASICEGLFGTGTTANIFLLGVAVQAGGVAVSPASIERGIELNGVAVDRNLGAFRWGRRWATDPTEVERAAGITPPPAPETLDQLIARLSDDLADYQSERYAARFRRRVQAVRDCERSVVPESTELTDAVARNLHKLMAYKDEYEVARLLLLPDMAQQYDQVGGRGATVTWHLHPPMLRALGMSKKIKMGPSTRPAFRALRRAKRLRGTPADPFRYAEVRKVERAMIPEYESAVDTLIARLSHENHRHAVEIASLPDQVRGYEDLKLRRAHAYRDELAGHLARFT